VLNCLKPFRDRKLKELEEVAVVGEEILEAADVRSQGIHLLEHPQPVLLSISSHTYNK